MSLKFIHTKSRADADFGKWMQYFKNDPSSSLILLTVALISAWRITARACSCHCFSLYQSPSALSPFVTWTHVAKLMGSADAEQRARGNRFSPPSYIFHPSSVWPFIHPLTLPLKHTHKHTHTHIYLPLLSLSLMFIHLRIPAVIVHPHLTLFTLFSFLHLPVS